MRCPIIILLVLLWCIGHSQDKSAAGNCYSGQTGTYFELSAVLQAINYLGWSERIELEINGGNYGDFGQHVYLVDARGGLDVRAYQIGHWVHGYELKIYDNGNADNHSDKYVIGIIIPDGSWRSICVRARELNSKQWITISATQPPNLPEVPFNTKWLYKSYNQLFEVNGTIRSKEVKVEAAPWPDYVFSSEYNLKSLEETETYIKENQRLPDMPSAAEVAENGIALGEMNRLLLEKVEELTLHVIELRNEVNELKSKGEK